MSSSISPVKISRSVTGALIAVLALLLVVCLMNKFGNRSGVSPQAVLASPKPLLIEAHDNVGSKVMLENTHGDTCSLADAKLDQKTFEQLITEQDLRCLKLVRCTFVAPFNASVASKSSLRKVSISASELDDQAIKFLSQMPDLKCVELYSCALKPQSLYALSNSHIVKLQLLNSDEVSESGNFTISDLEHIAASKSLKHLDLEQSKLEPGAVQALASSSIRVMNLKHCNLTDADLASLSENPSLKFIQIANNPEITDRGIQKLLKAKGISQIKCDTDMSSCNLSKSANRKVDPALYEVPVASAEK